MTVILLFSFHNRQTVTAQSKNTEQQTVEYINSRYQIATDTNFVWNPEAIYVILPNMKLEFKLPHEKDQSGVANLLFQDMTSGEIHLLDTIKNSVERDIVGNNINTVSNFRYFTQRIPGKYNAILLYNNGKYIRYNDVVFEKGADRVVDMENLSVSVQPADSESQHWLNLRRFITAIGTRKLPENDASNSERKIQGYIFWEDGDALQGAGVYGKDEKQFANSLNDGYFEINADDCQTLKIMFLGVETQYINIKSNSGLFLMLKEAEEYKRLTVPENLKTGPLKKIPINQ